MNATALAELAAQIQRYESFVQADAGNALIWLQLGDLYHRASRYDEATACFERHALLTGDNRIAQGRIASVLISRHEFNLAEQKLKSLMQTEVDDAALLHNLGLVLFHQDRWNEAETYFHRARELGLGTASNFAYLSRSLHYAGKMDEAIAACQEWVAREPNARSIGYLALLEMDQSHAAEALRLAHKALALDPDQIDAGIVVANAAVEQQDMDDAKRRFESAVRQQPDNGRAWLGLGLVHLYDQAYADAILALERAVRLMPDNSGSIVALGWAHLCNKDAHRAEAIFRDAIRVDRNFGEAHGGLATALAFQNKVDQAKETARASLRLDPRNLGAGFANTILLKLSGRDEAAHTLLSKLLQSSPTPDAKPLIEQLLLFGNKNAAKLTQKTTT